MSRKMIAAGGAVVLAAVGALTFSGLRAEGPATTPVMTVYKSPTCGCCSRWVEHVRANGFEVHAHDVSQEQLAGEMAERGVTRELTSCHVATVDGYTIVGHVPADVVRRLLDERPDVAGISVPGMPIGTPGMEQGERRDEYAVIAFTDEGERFVYEQR